MYEVLIATGDAENAGTDKKIHFALICDDGQGGERTSDFLRPGQNAIAHNSFQRGMLDICFNCDFKDAGGGSFDSGEIVGVMVWFEGDKWFLDKVWITHTGTGKAAVSHLAEPLWLGDDSGLGDSESNAYRLDLAPETASEATQEREMLFTFKVKTQDATESHPKPGTDNEVYFKLFGACGRASRCDRGKKLGDQYEEGDINTIRGWDVGYAPIDTRVIRILVFKRDQPADDAWRPERIVVAPGVTALAEPHNRFPLTDVLPGGVLEGHHRWVYASADPLLPSDSSAE